MRLRRNDSRVERHPSRVAASRHRLDNPAGSLTATILTALLVTVGCDSVTSSAPKGDAAPPTQAPVTSKAQAAALADGRVTEAEYHQGFRRYAACLAAAGYELFQVNDRGVRIDFSVPSEAVDSGADKTCYEREFRAVDIQWQTTQDDPQLTDAYRRCLLANNLTPPSTQEEMIKILQQHGIDPGSCRPSAG